jgi:hypothetical protein
MGNGMVPGAPSEGWFAGEIQAPEFLLQQQNRVIREIRAKKRLPSLRKTASIPSRRSHAAQHLTFLPRSFATCLFVDVFGFCNLIDTGFAKTFTP